MSLSVAQVINHARDLHPALSPQNAPVPVAIRALSRFQRGIVAEITKRVPAWLAVLAEVDMSTVTLDDGVALGTLIPAGWLDALQGSVTFANDRKRKAVFVPWEQRDIPTVFPSFTLRDGTLFFIGRQAEWGQVSTFTLSYTGLPDDLETPASLFVLPDDARECLAEMLASEWLGRMVDQPAYGVPSATAQFFVQRAGSAKREFLSRVYRLTQRQKYVVRDVYGGMG